MLRSLSRGIPAVTLAVIFVANCYGQQKPAYELLPNDTQAAVWIRSADELLAQWDRTELAKLTADEKIAPFFREKRQEIEKRFMEAGWRLNVKPDDLGEYSTGQVALGWTQKVDVRKPYAIILIADVDDDPVLNARMLKRFDEQLKQQKVQAQKSTLPYQDVVITKYVLPSRPGEFLQQDSFIAVVNGQLLASDDEAMIKQLIDRAKGRLNDRNLASDQLFQKSRQLAKVSGEGNVEYFIRPIGFAKVIRSIAGSRSKSNTDLLAALEKQGFAGILSICGEMKVGGADMDIEHHGYVYATKPFVQSARILDFPNQASNAIPNFIGENIAAMTVINWNASEAFWSAEGIVDELAGTEGVFNEVIEGIKSDPNGPRIDIRNVLPNFTNDIYSVSDAKEGEADVDSRRNMIAFRLKNPADMAKVLDQAMSNEPDAEQLDFSGHSIWQVVHREDDINLSEFDDFGAPPAAAAPAEQPWLSNWAITVHGDYLIFASHVELIQESITRGVSVAESPLLQTEDYQRVVQALKDHFGDAEACGWRILRPKQAYRVNYELFRKGELRRSQSMLASLLDRLLQNKEEQDDKDQKISGEGLPDFEEIEQYLQPGGFRIQSTSDGWLFEGMILGKKKTQSELNYQRAQYGTARAPGGTEANR